MTGFIPGHYEILILSFVVAVLGKFIDWSNARGFPRIFVILMEVVLIGLVALMGYSVYLLFA